MENRTDDPAAIRCSFAYACLNPQESRCRPVVQIDIWSSRARATWGFPAATRESNDSRRVILLGAFLLMGIIVLGPGYGPQYIAWFLPLLALTATSFDASWRRILMAWGAIAVVTYLVEYLLLPSHGALLVHLLPDANFGRAGVLATPAGLTVLRLPLFLSYCLLWGKAGVLLMKTGGTDCKLESAA